MKEIMQFYVFILFISFFYIVSCNSENTLANEVEPITTVNRPFELNIIWQTPLEENTTFGFSIHPILTDFGILTSYYNYMDNERMIMLDKNSGGITWDWDDYIATNPGQRIKGTNRLHLFNESLIACSSQDNYSINLFDGTTKWSTYTEHGYPSMSLSNNMLFHNRFYGNLGSHPDSVSLMVCNPDIGNWKKLMTVKSDSFYHFIYKPTSFINNETNDTSIILQLKQRLYLPNTSKTNLVSYNITQKRINWMKKNRTDFDWGHGSPPLIDGDRCYFVGTGNILCLDIHTGEEIWNYHHGHVMQLSNYLIHDNLFIIKDDGTSLLAVDKNTGERVWLNSDHTQVGACCVNMRVYGDRIYYGGGGYLYIIDVNTGENLYRLSSPNEEQYHGARFANAVAVDLDEQVMYTTDGYFLMKMELPE